MVLPMSTMLPWLSLYFALKGVKSVRIQGYPGPYFLAFGLNTER